MTAFDPQTSCLIKQKIYVGAFKQYYISDKLEEKSYSIKLDIKQFATYIKQVGANNIMVWYINNEKTDTLVMVFKDVVNNVTNERHINLLNGIRRDNIKIPEANFTCEIKLPTEIFHKYIKDSSSVLKADKIVVSFIDTKRQPNTIKFSSPDNMNSCTLNTKTTDLFIKKDKSNDEDIIIRNTYKLQTLVAFGKSITFCSTVKLLLHDDYPLLVTYENENYGYTILAVPAERNSDIIRNEVTDLGNDSGGEEDDGDFDPNRGVINDEDEDENDNVSVGDVELEEKEKKKEKKKDKKKKKKTDVDN
jgi:hypothetical protein